MIEYDLHYRGNFVVSQFTRLHTRFSAQESTWMLFDSVVSLWYLTELSELLTELGPGKVSTKEKCQYIKGGY